MEDGLHAPWLAEGPDYPRVRFLAPRDGDGRYAFMSYAHFTHPDNEVSLIFVDNSGQERSSRCAAFGATLARGVCLAMIAAPALRVAAWRLDSPSASEEDRLRIAGSVRRARRAAACLERFACDMRQRLARRRFASRCIARRLYAAYCDPTTELCRRRLAQEFDELREATRHQACFLSAAAEEEPLDASTSAMPVTVAMPARPAAIGSAT
jgi:hypothetical protein